MSNHNNQMSPEQNYQVLLDALKYTSDIVVTLTEKNTINENKINSQENKIISLENKTTYLEKIFSEQRNLVNKNNNMLNEFDNKITLLEKNIISSINKDNLLLKNNEKSNVDLDFLSQSINDLNQLKDRLILNSNSNEELDIETINNTICNSTLLSDVTSFNIEDIDKFKKQKTATSLVENLIKRKQEIEDKIIGLTSNSNPSIIIENDQSGDNKDSKDSKDSKNIDLNAIRRKKNFARKF